MKNVLGGKIAPSDGPCALACTGTAASNYQGGTCSSSPGSIPGTTNCTCSVINGSGC